MLTYKNVKLDKIETGQKGKVKYLIDGKEYLIAREEDILAVIE